jgi:TetR/AcrR family transcriptional regulator, fatty acid metabolism regulator protein
LAGSALTAKRKEKLSFIEETRRKQIIESAIQTIAEQGFQRTTLDLIADNVNVSKGVITYHFESKNELIQSVLERIILEQRIYRETKINEKITPWGKLQAYIKANIDFFKTFPHFLTAQIELWGAITSREEKKNFEMTAYLPGRRMMEGILRQGQKSGDFVDFNPQEVTAVILSMIDGLMIQCVFCPGQVDLERCGQEIIRFCARRILSPVLYNIESRKVHE